SHLRRRLDGEGDGDDLLGLLDRGEEADVALHQELGLARAGGRLDDERAAHVERFFAGAAVGERFSAGLTVGEDLHFLRSGCGLAVAGHGLTLCFDYRPRAPLTGLDACILWGAMPSAKSMVGLVKDSVSSWSA